MELTIAVWIVGLMMGGVVGWKSGRLHLEAQLRYGDWREAVHAVPITYRSAARSIKSVLKYGATLILLASLTLTVLWSAHSKS